MATATADPPAAAGAFPPPFGVEIATQRNGDVILQNIPGERLRGEIDPRRGVRTRDPETGELTDEEVIPSDQAVDMAGFPKLPGQQVHVNPKQGTYSIFDPLSDDEDLCDRVKAFMARRRGARTADKLRGVPTRKGNLDRHSCKTLCRELLNLVESGDARFVRGGLSQADVDAMPGRYLLQPGITTQTLMPRYEDEWDSYVEHLRTSGG